MASIECRDQNYRILFSYRGERKGYTLGRVTAAVAAASKAATEELLGLLKRNLITIPRGCKIEKYMLYGGNPPEEEEERAEIEPVSLGKLRDAYLAGKSGKLEEITLAWIRMHFGHFSRLIGDKTSVDSLGHRDIQVYVDTRSAEWIDPNVFSRARGEGDTKPMRHPSATTIRKEIGSLRAAWNWGRKNLGLTEAWPAGRLDYHKTEESLPFMTISEVEARIASGDTNPKLWDWVYLRPQEVDEFLDVIRRWKVAPWIYPMVCFAAHTGTRRSEILRMLPSDLNLKASVATIREKKRGNSKLTTRRVPITPFLQDVLLDWLKTRPESTTLFCRMTGGTISPRLAHNQLKRGIARSPWPKLRGWHIFRHSFISALASNGVDQRIIDEVVGHQTEAIRRRYRHLYPDVVQKAVFDVFKAPTAPPSGTSPAPGG